MDPNFWEGRGLWRSERESISLLQVHSPSLSNSNYKGIIFTNKLHSLALLLYSKCNRGNRCGYACASLSKEKEGGRNWMRNCLLLFTWIFFLSIYFYHRNTLTTVALSTSGLSGQVYPKSRWVYKLKSTRSCNSVVIEHSLEDHSGEEWGN